MRTTRGQVVDDLAARTWSTRQHPLPLQYPTRLVDLLPDDAELSCELIVVKCLQAKEFGHTILKGQRASPCVRAVLWASCGLSRVNPAPLRVPTLREVGSALSSGPAAGRLCARRCGTGGPPHPPSALPVD